LYLTLFSNANTFQTGLPRLRNKTSPLANHKIAQNSKYAIPIPKEQIENNYFIGLSASGPF